MRIRLNIAIFIGILAGAFLGLVADGTASAHTVPVIPGSTCAQIGELGTHGGQTYRCEKHLGEVCESWHWVYSGSVPRSGRTVWPHPSCPCVSASATPTPAASTTPAALPSATPADTSSPQPVHSTAIAVVPAPSASTSPLPVTGSPVFGIGALGGALVATGGLILFAVRIRRTARP
jgi:hypothetical protein